MKTSNIIIVALLLLIPGSMLVANFGIRSEYRKGNFKKVKSEVSNILHKELPPFRYMVLDGKVHMNARLPVDVILDIKPVRIEISEENKPGVRIAEFLEPYLKSRVSGDTLYMWFEAKYPQEWQNRGNSHGLIITGNTLEALYLKDARFGLDKLRQSKPCRIDAMNTEFEGGGQQVLPRLDLHLSKSRMFSGTMQVDTLAYSLGAGSILNLSMADSVKVFLPGTIDPNAGLQRHRNEKPVR